MIAYIFLGILLVAVTVLIHAVGTSRWLSVLIARFAAAKAAERPVNMLRILISTAVILLVLHTAQILLWAFAYLYLLPAAVLDTLEEAAYFSFVTFTTLGYGDVTLAGPWRIISGIEALNGILLLGWSTALLFAVVQRGWQETVQVNDTEQESE